MAVLSKAEEESNAVLVGEDTDLLVLTVGLPHPSASIFMMIPGSIDSPRRVFSGRDMAAALPVVRQVILFLHVMTGCDTTSGLFRQGKSQAFRLVQKKREMRQIAAVFMNAKSTKSEIERAGEKFLVELYGGKKGDVLNKTRFKKYVRAVARQPIHIHGKLELAALPPTLAAAISHFYRVYHQVQQWLGNDLDPTEWACRLQASGWRSGTSGNTSGPRLASPSLFPALVRGTVLT